MGIKTDRIVKKEIVLFLLFVIAFFVNSIYSNKTIYVSTTLNDTIFLQKYIDKEKLFESFVFVESRYNDDTINKSSGAAGCVQIMPILIDEANRLSGYKKYSLNDRFSRGKSKEIFYLIMDNKNPKYDLHLACKIWNPKSKLSYHKAIEDKYNELINK